jgi:hypothetical protein
MIDYSKDTAADVSTGFGLVQLHRLDLRVGDLVSMLSFGGGNGAAYIDVNAAVVIGIEHPVPDDGLDFDVTLYYMLCDGKMITRTSTSAGRLLGRI